MTVEKSLPTQEVSAIGLKLLGRDGSICAVDLAISLTAAIFQAEGIVEHVQHRLKMLCRADRRAGHFLKTMYGIPSKGDGDDLERAFLTARVISSRVMSFSLNSATGAVAEGIQDG